MPGVLETIPSHIPPELVVDFDFNQPPGIEDGDVYGAWRRLYAGPDIVWSPHYGGHWILTRGEDIRAIQSDHEHFSHKDFGLPRGGKPMRLPPLDLDPPDHAAYRVLLNPFFAPRVVAELEAKARALTVQLIDDLKPKGGCDFVADFARVLPVTVFLDMMDLPLSLRTQFIGWAEAVLQASTAEAKLAAFKAIVGYLGGVIAEREDARGDDLVSRLLDARDAGKMPHPDDALGVVTLLFLGGIDTVANMLAFTAGFLAGSPAHRRRLVEDPEVVPRAVEEFIRRFGLSNTIRTLTVDYEYKGVRFREGEAVMVPISMSSMDDRIYDRPLEIDFNRDNPRGHDTFGNGPHRCVGMHLARAEMRIFLQEWVKRIPDFEIPPGASAPSISASVNAVKALPLAWPVE